MFASVDVVAEATKSETVALDASLKKFYEGAEQKFQIISDWYSKLSDLLQAQISESDAFVELGLEMGRLYTSQSDIYLEKAKELKATSNCPFYGEWVSAAIDCYGIDKFKKLIDKTQAILNNFYSQNVDISVYNRCE